MAVSKERLDRAYADPEVQYAQGLSERLEEAIIAFDESRYTKNLEVEIHDLKRMLDRLLGKALRANMEGTQHPTAQEKAEVERAVDAMTERLRS